MAWLANQKPVRDKKRLAWLYCSAAFVFAVNLISFSRSNWVGLLFGLFFLAAVFVKNRKWRRAGRLALDTLIAGALALLIIIAIVKFPYPNPIGGFDAANLLSERAGQLSGEAGVSSRWSLLPELWRPIKNNLFLGGGLGKTVTYLSQDPRVLQTNPNGEYTTYAFEWGWLDIWLKLGIFGLLSYLLLAAVIIFKITAIYKMPGFNDDFLFGLAAGMIAILAISFFSPYMNHPLGLGYLMLLSVFYEKTRQLYPHLR
jgi:O-antigen ligase